MDGERLRLNMMDVRSGSTSFMRNSSSALLVSSPSVREDWSNGLSFARSRRRRRALHSLATYQYPRKARQAKVKIEMMTTAAMEPLSRPHSDWVDFVTGTVLDFADGMGLDAALEVAAFSLQNRAFDCISS